MRSLLLVPVLLLAARFSYVYMPVDQRSSVAKGSLDRIVRVQKQYDSPYIWAELDGRRYLIRDAAALREVERAMAPRRALEPKKDALRRRMKPVERRFERLEDERDDLSDAGKRVPAQLEEEYRTARRELEQYEREEERLDAQIDALDGPIDGTVRAVVERAIRDGRAQRVR